LFQHELFIMQLALMAPLQLIANRVCSIQIQSLYLFQKNLFI
jgi:hypothetical protein